MYKILLCHFITRTLYVNSMYAPPVWPNVINEGALKGERVFYNIYKIKRIKSIGSLRWWSTDDRQISVADSCDWMNWLTGG